MTRRSAHPARLLRVSVLLLATGTLAVLASLGLAASAAAHASQTGAEPAAGSVLSAAPSRVVITFDTALMDVGAALVVRDAAGSDVTDGPPRLRANTIAVPLRADLGAGTYAVAYRVVSEDGHPVTASYTFTVSGTPAASPEATISSPANVTPVPTPAATPAAMPAAETASGSPGVIAAIAAVVAVAAVGVVVLLVRVRRR